MSIKKKVTRIFEGNFSSQNLGLGACDSTKNRLYFHKSNPWGLWTGGTGWKTRNRRRLPFFVLFVPSVLCAMPTTTTTNSDRPDK